ncbi:unnamed protein product, partial [Rotaria magnacalcarata]
MLVRIQLEPILTLQNGQTRSLSNRGTMPSPPIRKGNSKGVKSSEPSRPFNNNQ